MQQVTHIQDNRSALPGLFRLLRLFLALAVIVVWAEYVSAQRFPPDAVEDLRQALRQDRQPRIKKEALDFRRANLDTKIKALNTIGELGRAMLLQDWRDQDLEPAVAAIDSEMRRSVATRFEKNVRDVLEHGDVPSRWAVANLVGEMAVLARGTGSPNPFVRNHLASLVPDLVKFSQRKTDPRLPEAAARALGKIHPELKDVKALTTALGELLTVDRIGTRRAAAEALGSLMQIVSQNEKRLRSNVGRVSLRHEVVQVSTGVVNAAAKGLGDNSPEVRRLCAAAIHEAANNMSDLVEDVPPPDFFPPEKRPLDDAEKAMIRGYRNSVDEEFSAIEPLMAALMAKAETAKGPLATALNDPDLAVRVLARRIVEDVALTRQRLLKREGSIPAWARAERKPNKPITQASRELVTPTLEENGPIPALPLLAPQDTVAPDAVPAGHGESAETLFTDEKVPAKLPADPRWDAFRNTTVTELTRGLVDPDVRGRLAAIDALELIGEGAAPAAPALIARLTDPDRYVRWAAARTLGKMGPVEPTIAVPALAQLLTDPDPDLRITAANALERYGPVAREAVPALAQTTATGDTEVRLAALRALDAIGKDSAPAIPAMTTALANPDVRVRRLAADLLSHFGPLPQSSTPALRRALDDSDPLVRKSASIALLNAVPLSADK